MRRVGETVRCEGAPLGVGGRDRRWGRAAARQPVPRGPRPEGSESEEGTPEDAARGGETDGAAELEPEPEPEPQPQPEPQPLRQDDAGGEEEATRFQDFDDFTHSTKCFNNLEVTAWRAGAARLGPA